MARSVRVEFPGAFYHVMARPIAGNRFFSIKEWLAEKLQMRSAANVSQLLRRAVVKRRNRQVPSRFADFINRAIQAAE